MSDDPRQVPPGSRGAAGNRSGGLTPESSFQMQVTCYGARGSIPSPGPSTAFVGGNTPCLEVRTSNGQVIILDAGTGIRELGRRLEATDSGVIDLFLTHFHWDHIQGIPFFVPFYDSRRAFRIHGPRQGETDIETLFAAQLGPIYFPIPFGKLAASLEFRHLDETPWARGGVEVSSFRVRHPSSTYGYRVAAGGAAIVYVPDNELVGASYEADRTDWRSRFVRFVRGADLLFHDAMFTEDEYRHREGWGHSTLRQAVELAEEAEVRRLLLFHHAPDRSDEELLRILDELRNELSRRPSGLELSIAREGERHQIEEEPRAATGSG